MEEPHDGVRRIKRVSVALEDTVLSSIVPERPRRLFGSLQGLDLASHWFHMYSTMTTGGPSRRLSGMSEVYIYIIEHSERYISIFKPRAGHHKSAETLKARNFVLRAYYSSYPLFAYLCVGAELTYVALYVRRRVKAVEIRVERFRIERFC